MQSELYGSTTRPVIAIVGTWDPLLPKHLRLFAQLKKYADRVSRQALVIMLDPAPPSLMWGRIAEWPVYDAPDMRLALIRSCGIDAIQIVRFIERDLDAPLSDFFRVICRRSKLEELVLGDRQLFGRGSESTPAALQRIAKRRNFHLLRLPPENSPPISQEARDCIRNGKLRVAIRLVGRPPVWRRPVRGQLRLPWPAGPYDCSPLSDPLGNPGRRLFRVEMSSQKNGFAKMSWPDKTVRWLAFTAGPADL